MRVHKFLYIMVYLVTPFIYFIVSIIWGKFILENPHGIIYQSWESIIVSIFWLVNMKTIDIATEKIERNKK